MVQVRGRRCAPYVRELSEVGGVEVEPLRQPLHQVQALVVGEGTVEWARHNTEQVGVRLTHTRPLKRLSFLVFLICVFSLFLGGTAALPAATDGVSGCNKHTQKVPSSRGAEKGSAASLGLTKSPFFPPFFFFFPSPSDETNNKVQMEPA